MIKFHRALAVGPYMWSPRKTNLSDNSTERAQAGTIIRQSLLATSMYQVVQRRHQACTDDIMQDKNKSALILLLLAKHNICIHLSFLVIGQSCAMWLQFVTKGSFPYISWHAFTEYSPYPTEPCLEGISEEPCPETETFTEGFVDEGLPEGYEDSAEGFDPEYEPSQEESSPQELQEEAIDGTYDEGYTEGSAEFYSAGYDIEEEAFGIPEELSPEYSSSGKKQTAGMQLDLL